jgi:hypothetical protein
MLIKIKHIISGIICEIKYRFALVQHRSKLPLLSESDRFVVETLKREGAYVTTLIDLGLPLPTATELLRTAKRQLAQMEKVDHHHLAEKLPQIYTVTDIPEIATWGKEPRLLNLIENYIGLPIAFHGVHLRKDFPSEHQFNTLLWHKDAEDRRIIKVFVYLEDVLEKHGPFEYIPKSLTSIFSWEFYRIYLQLWLSGHLGINDQKLAKIIPKSAWKSCQGKAGTVIIADTKSVLHHGTLRTEARASLFFCYTAKSPKRPELCTQYWDNTFPHPTPYTLHPTPSL